MKSKQTPAPPSTLTFPNRKLGEAAPPPPPAAAARPPMRIIRFQAENIKRIKLVDITPVGNMVYVTGANGSGKTSVLDAIMYVLTGTTNIPSRPIRNGAEHAKIVVDLGEITVRRKFTAGKNPTGYLEIFSNGDNKLRYPSPQSILDKLLGTVSFDPLEFMRMEPKKQLEMLRTVAPPAIDITALDAEIKVDYLKRREMDKEAEALQPLIDNIRLPPDLPADPIDVGALVAEMRQAGEANSVRAATIGNIERLKTDEEQAAQRMEFARGRAKDLELEIRKLQKDRETHLSAAAQEKETLEQLKRDRDAIQVPEVVNVAPLEAQIADAQTRNAGVQNRKRREELEQQQAAKLAEARELDGIIEAKRKQRLDAIVAVKMPVEGLDFGEGEVMFEGLPFAQQSDASQIKISVALAMAANPTIRVLRIKDGSLLDEKSMAAIEAMAITHDYQVWVERVDTSGEVGIVLEAGEVVKINPPKIAAAAKKPAAKKGKV